MMTLQQTQNTIAENVRRLRNEHHLSIATLAVNCGLCPNSIIAVESGQSNSQTDTLYKISAYFGMEVCKLMIPTPKAEMPDGHRKAVLYLRKSIAYQQAAARYFAQVMDDAE